MLPDEVKKNFSATADFVSLEELLKEADVVSIHVPLNEYTRNMIAWEQLNMMKPSAIW